LSANFITDFGGLDEEDSSRSGTLAYRAPELAGDGVPTMQSDVYAAGLILFQLVAGDFSRFLAPGWEDAVADPLLREDIALAAAADPSRRFAADDLADRLATLDARRAAAAESARLLVRAEALAKAEERRRHRRPWVRAAAAAVVIGLAGTSTMAVLAIGQRDRARVAQSRAEASYAFLADDILASPDPSHADAADERLVDVVRRASNGIDRRFAHTPLVAARLYATLARAFDQRSEYGIGRDYYRRAEHWFRRAGAAGSEEANIMRLQHASAEALSTQAGSLDRARALVAAARRSLGPERAGNGAPAVWLEAAEGMIALAAEDVPNARDHSGRAATLADALPERFDERQRLNLHQRHAFTLLRLGDPAGAARELTPLVAAMSRLQGPDHPDTLLLRLNLAQAKANSGHYEAALADLTPLIPLLESRMGATHRLTLLALSVRQLALGSLGRYGEAAADAERVWRAAAAKDGPTSFQAVAARSDLGTTQCRAGDYTRGEANTRAAYRSARAARPDESALAQAIRAAVADCLIADGRAPEAAPLLRNIDRERVNQLVGDAHWDASLDVSLGEIALAQGDRAEAVARLRAAAAVYTSPPSDHYLAARFERLQRAVGAAPTG
jgi:hypothetical protein